MKSIVHIRLFLIIYLAALFAGCGEDTPVSPVAPLESVGLVSGTITNASTGLPVRGAVVTISGRQWESDVEGKYSFAQVDFSDALTIAVEALDYAGETRTVALNTENVTVDISLVPLTNPVDEIRSFLDKFSALIETVDTGRLLEIEDLFTEEYLASDDLITRFFGLNTGLIPVNRNAVTPVFTALFEEFNLIQFQFRNIEMDVPHPRQASAKLGVDIITEKGARSVRREIVTRCELYFRKAESGWKIFFWQFLEADVHL